MPRIIESRAPNRILDFGGWTDTHFAKRGRVVNLAVTLFAQVTMITRDQPGATIHILDYGDRLEVADVVKEQYGTKHDLLLAALKVMPIETGLDVYITADVPPGCSTGSSAAITVALLKGLSVLADKPLVPHELSRLAHSIETEELGDECGVQDQIASAYGGMNYVSIDPYPKAEVSPIPLSEATRLALESRLLLVYEGAGHLSSDVHRQVIEGMSEPGSKVEESIAGLTQCAEDAKAAVITGDLEALAEIMNRNNGLQKALHPNITTERIERIEEAARAKGAAGAMINGAGGGGSITLLCRPGARAVAADALRREGFTILPCTIACDPAMAWEGSVLNTVHLK
jgi:D-glycero-alpha-D-manno-heptose-7-phosphate kinase